MSCQSLFAHEYSSIMWDGGGGRRGDRRCMRAAMQISGFMKHIHYVAGSHESSTWEVVAGALTGVPSRPLPARLPAALSPGLLLMTAWTPRNLE